MTVPMLKGQMKGDDSGSRKAAAGGLFAGGLFALLVLGGGSGGDRPGASETALRATSVVMDDAGGQSSPPGPDVASAPGPLVVPGGDFFAGAEWCQPPKSPPLNYDACKDHTFVYKYGVWGGMTNALNFLLRGTVQAFEDGRCFTIDQTGPTKYSPMADRDPPMENVKAFLHRYFEPIGLPYGGDSSPEGVEQHPIVRDASKIRFYPYPEIGDREGERLKKARQTNNGKRTIPGISGMKDLDNLTLKKGLLRRYWRLLPERRETVCRRLSTHGITEEYMAFSIRRGDKKIEHDGKSEQMTVQMYLDEADKAIDPHFGGKIPTVFVATDDCAAVEELRALRPSWKFVSECDRAGDGSAAGFVLDDMTKWTLETTDAHYEKFFAELIGMAEAKHWIGVSFTNVAFWVYYMRHYTKTDDTVVFLDSPGFERNIVNNM
uniref:Uncharacterized protein n=1 Tax=Odontella aurita TaxID=265563 RepID=A0A7S4JJJ0_9STRA